MIARRGRTLLVGLGIGACALACAVPGLLLVAMGGASMVMLGAPMAIAAGGIVGAAVVAMARRRAMHACPDGACTCE